MIHFLYFLLCLPSVLSEFTVVLPDSNSPLIDSPQTGFSSHALTDPEEQKAVYEVMAATGNSWAGSIPDICRGRWHGIECTPDTNDAYHVVSLSFGALSDDTAFPTCDRHTATLHPAILRLTHLRTLFFYRCFVDNPQPIPAFLGKLGPTLQSLVLRDNGHVGPIPAELGNLTYLKLLDLHGNRLTSSVPGSLSRLTRIRKLDLSNNRLTGGIPELRSPDLNILDLSHNFLQGGIHPSVTRYDSLIKLDLSRNRITGPIPDPINNLKNLMLLDLSHNLLSGPLPVFLQSLTSLQALILKGNSMGPTVIPNNWFPGLEQLSTLVLSNMGLNGPIPESVGDLVSLRVLHLDGNEINGSIPSSLGKLNHLSELRLENNLLTGLIPLRKEMIWKMGRNLKVDNNTGLCYDINDGELKGVASLSAISYCDPETTTSVRTTQHIFSSFRGGLPVSHRSSSRSNCESWVGRLIAMGSGFMLCAVVLL